MPKIFDLWPICCCFCASRRCAATQNNTDVDKCRKVCFSLEATWLYAVTYLPSLSSEAHTAVFVSASLPVWIRRLRINRAGFHQAAVGLNVTRCNSAQILVPFPAPATQVSKPYQHLCNWCLSGDLDDSIKVIGVLNHNCLQFLFTII